MKKWTFTWIAVTCLISSIAVAQVRFSIAPLIAPMLSDIWVQGPGLKVISRAHWGYTVGGAAYLHFGPNWSISAGIGLNRRSFDYPANGFLSRRQYIQLPLLLNYRSSRKKLSPIFSFGLQLESQRRAQLWQGDQLLAEDTSRPAPIFLLQAMIGAGASYQLSPNFTLLLQPQVSYRSENPTERIFQVGLSTQVMYTF